MNSFHNDAIYKVRQNEEKNDLNNVKRKKSVRKVFISGD